MSYNVTLKHKKVSIRKPRRCWGCWLEQKKKTIMTYVVSVFEGQFGTSYWCEVCSTYLSTNTEFMQDGVGQGDFAGEVDYHRFKKAYNEQQQKDM